jgi:hypothetical protein
VFSLFGGSCGCPIFIGIAASGNGDSFMPALLPGPPSPLPWGRPLGHGRAPSPGQQPGESRAGGVPLGSFVIPHTPLPSGSVALT